MEKVDFLPLGSIVIIKGGVKKFMIIARGLEIKVEGSKQYFDYAGVTYPEGLTGDSIMYFQHADIAKVIAQGFSDDDNILMVDNLNESLAGLQVPRADVRQLIDSEVAK